MRHRCALAVLLVVLLAAPPIAVAQQPDAALRQARQHYAADRYEDARDALLPLLESDPDGVDANLLMGRIEMVLGDLDAADRHLQRAEGASGRGRFLVPQTQGLVRLRRRDWAAALERFDEALRRAPDYSGARIARAKTLAYQGQVDAALAELAAVLQGPEPQPAAQLLTGELLLARGDLEGAFKELQAVVQTGQEGAAVENATMYLATFAVSPQETAARVRRGMSRIADRAAPWFWLAVGSLSIGDAEVARRQLQVALSVNELHAPSHVALRGLAAPGEPAPRLVDLIGPPLPGLDRRLARLRAALERGDTVTVASGARDLVALRPGLVPAHMLLVDVASRSGDLLRLLEALDGLAGAADDLPDAHARRAIVAREVGAMPMAEAEARRAVELVPDAGALRYLLATVLAATGQAEAAIAECKAALERGYDEAALHVTLGNMYSELQRLPEAVAELAMAVEMEPAAAESIAAFALDAMTAEDADKLVALLDRVLEQRPDSPNVLYALGSLQQRRGEPEQAASLFERLLELQPSRSEIHYNLALAYRRLGREADAAQHTQRFEQLKVQERQLWEAGNATNQRRADAIRAMESDEADRAVELLRRVVDAPGAEPRDEVLLGNALMASGQFQPASDAYRRALQGMPYDPAALCGAASAADALGRPVEADSLRHRIRVLDSTCTVNSGGGNARPPN